MVYMPEIKKDADYALMLDQVNVFYGSYHAVKDVTIPIERGKITAFIGPSGCGKSTVIKTINRMNDLVDSAHVTGKIMYRGNNLYDTSVDPVEVRRRIGMVFQKPNPFPKSIFENVAYGPRLLGVKNKDMLQDIVERSLRGAALWDEVNAVYSDFFKDHKPARVIVPTGPLHFGLSIEIEAIAYI